MEIKIGIQHINREVVVDSPQTADEVEQALNQAIADGGLLSLTGERGRKVVVPAAAIGYVEFGDETTRRVGFGAV